MRLRFLGRNGLAAIALGTAVLASPPAPARAESVVRYASSAEPRTLDSIVNWLSITHQHSYLVYDTLYSPDAKFQPQPQMVEKAELGADKLTWTITLREGLAFHDGSPVTSADVLASIRRWAKRDVVGHKLEEMGLQLAAIDARHFTAKLNVLTPLLFEAWAKPTATALIIMREKDAETDPFTAVKEIVGSGPFRFNAAEYRPGDKLIYDRNPAYKPRSEPPSFLSGGKVVNVDRVEWIVEPDSATAVAALQKGELDIYETPPLDLLPLLAARPDIAIEVHGTQGQIGYLRPNFKQPPFDKLEARKALALLIDQPDYMAITAGADGKYWKTCFSFLACGGANETQAGTEWMQHPNVEEAKKLFQQAGYKGEKVVIIAPGDNEIIKGFGTMTAEKLRAAGVNVDIQYMDFATMMARRNKQDAPDQGGWNIFPMWSYGFEFDNLMGNVGLNTNCSGGGYPGWACNQKIEDMKDAWARESDPVKRRALIESIQKEAAQFVSVVPLGTFFAPIAFRKSITGLLPTPLPVFWNLSKK